jgi:hypothetical protein
LLLAESAPDLRVLRRLTPFLSSTPKNKASTDQVRIFGESKQSHFGKAAAQQQKFQALPPDKVAMIQKGGKTYYVFPDAANNRVLSATPFGE